ncbi:MAG: CPBP family intramembrane metalloprotease [Elusimicrobia bacterium]|nr:CPBP family intramembrane metalloprotease [Elusimicrobiota bacterium]
MKKHWSSLVAVWLALNPLSAVAQTKVGAVAAQGSSAGAASAAISAVIPGPTTNAVLPSNSVSLSVQGLSAAPVPTAVKISAGNAVQSVLPLVAPASIEVRSRKVTPSVAVKMVVNPLSVLKTGPAVPVTRSEKAVAVVRDEVANWSPRTPEDSVLAPSFQRSFSSLSLVRSAASTPESRDVVPAPRAPAPVPGRPALSKSFLIAGASFVGVALISAAVPALMPAAVVVWKGAFAWSGLAAMAASRYWRSPGSAPDVPRGPPAKAGGSFSSFKAAWAAARDSAAAQRSFEKRVGGSSWSSFRDWALGGLRTGLYWMAPSLLLMLVGAALAKGGMLLLGLKAAAAAPAAAAMIPLTALLGTYLPMALAAEAGSVALFFGVAALARKLGAGRAAPWLAGAAALGASAAVLMTLTSAPFIILVSLALEAGVLWTAWRSDSFLAPLALRSILTMFSLEAARLGAWIKFGAAGALVGLPPVWGGVAVAGLVFLAFKLKSPGLRLSEIGSWWNAEDGAQRPKSPGRILSAGLVWGLVVYAIGDLTFWAINAIAPGAEPAPGILAKMLTAGVDLVLYNFVIVGLLEEYVFRRGLFKSMNGWLDKRGLKPGKAFWTAAIGSALIFSGVHYIDWGAMLGWFGLGDPAASSGLAAGAYAFTWAGFVARSVLGVVLAWMYKRSGLLLIPIVAHFWADSMEGLGLAFGLPVFLALAAGALLLSFVFRPKALTPKSS